MEDFKAFVRSMQAATGGESCHVVARGLAVRTGQPALSMHLAKEHLVL
jgi:hypothetical protein